MKKVVIVIRGLPFNTIRNREALRVAVGLTLEEGNKVYVLFIDEGVLTAASLYSEIAKASELDKHIETLEMMEVELVAEREGLERWNLEVASPIKTEIREEINRLIYNADVVIPF